jgi:hypothetical protein
LAEQIAAARMLEHGITKERLPFVYGWHRLIVLPRPRTCACAGWRRSSSITAISGIDVVNSTGDQFSLLCEALPGERIRLNSYVQRQPLYTIAGGMPTATVELGDRVGRERRLGRPVYRRDAGPGPVDRALRPAAGGGAEPPDRRWPSPASLAVARRRWPCC